MMMSSAAPAGDRLALDPRTSVREIIRRHPQTVAVFERYGLMGCGGEQGPDEPLDFFARVHHVPVRDLLRDLGRVLDSEPGTESREPTAPASPRVGPPGRDAREARPFVPFFIASLGLTLTLGATLGMVNLARLTTTGWGVLSRPSVWAHAYVQVFGFVALFVMGVAYHVMPRFAGTPLQATRLVGWSLGLQVAGVLAVASGFLTGGALARPLWLAGSAALASAAVMFGTSIARTLRAGHPAPERFERWVLAGATWLVAASLIAFTGAILDDSTWHHVLWPVALYGFAGSWIFGVGRRILPLFLGWETRWPRLEQPVFLLYQAGVACWSAGAWPVQGAALHVLRAAGAVALLVAIPTFAASLGVFGRRSPPEGDLDRGYEPYLYAAWAWLFVGIATGPAWTLGAVVQGRYGSITMLDFSRHAVAFGFITQMIMGVASRVVPVFTGHPLWSPGARTLAFWLLNAALLIRGLEAVVAAGYWPERWALIALSGPLAVAAVSLFAVNVVLTVWSRDAVPARLPSGAPTLADRTVADLLQIPGALEVLVKAGFTPLQNPALRATFARTITLGQACRMRGIALEPLATQLDALTRAAQPPPTAPHVAWVPLNDVRATDSTRGRR